jgi:hypothetical protein
MNRRRSDKRIRKRKARARIIERYAAELRRAKVPPLVIKQAAPLMSLLLRR